MKLKKYPIARVIFMALLLSMVQRSYSDTVESIDPRALSFARSYGEAMRLVSLTKVIEKRFPRLAAEAQNARLGFEQGDLGQSVPALENHLKVMAGAKWTELKTGVDQTVRNLQTMPLTREAAVFKLQEIRDRTNRKKFDAITAGFLAAHPKYSNSVSAEFRDRWIQIFSSENNPRAKGIDFTVSFPGSWTLINPIKPTTIQSFRNNAGAGPITAALIIREVPEIKVLTELQLSNYVDRHIEAGMITPLTKVYSLKKMTLDGCPAIFMDIEEEGKQMDQTLIIRSSEFQIFYKGRKITIAFSFLPAKVMPLTADDFHVKYYEQYKAIANTFSLIRH
jgi:hypothetical protein